jgi:hypothetical protein
MGVAVLVECEKVTSGIEEFIRLFAARKTVGWRFLARLTR